MPANTANTMTMSYGMPNVHHPSAPKFDGKPISLSSYLDEVEQLARNNSLSVIETIQWSIRYLSPEEQQLWKALPSSKGNDWSKFRKELFECYPGAEDERRYTISNLETLVEKQSEFNITNFEQFGIYYRSFYVIASFLQDKKKLNEREISRFFIQGLHPSFRKQVRDQLHAEDPTHHPDDPFTLAEIRKAALFILSCNYGGSTAPPSSFVSSIPVPEPAAKTSQFNSASEFFPSVPVSNLVDAIMRRVEPLIQQKLASDHDHAKNNHSIKFSGCAFCSDSSHYVPNCDIAEMYVQQGFCGRNSENRITLPNGELVTYHTAPGSNLQERIDNWHRSNRSNVPTASSNLTIVAEAPDLRSLSAKSSQVDAEDVKQSPELAPAGITDEEYLRILEEFVESTQIKVHEIRRKLSARSSTQTKSANAEKDVTQATPLYAYTTSLSHSQLETAYSTLKVDSQATQKTSTGSVTPPRVKTISQHEVDAASPDIVPRSKIEVIKTIVPDRSRKKLESNRSTHKGFKYRTNIHHSSSSFIAHDPGARFLDEHRFRRRASQAFEQQSHSTIK
ncbi:hypothetical protein CVT26_000642 [Gymnopilus dilepis]|uniref:Retrotransposon gag domain-containing protein n=1 Tax=Gymnopilus dilepis TaxID=231916 RepID=A0A409X590_9AGAR|nr:hypothetical protein CVT26_000642 [Gymnopilus dilepis]